MVNQPEGLKYKYPGCNPGVENKIKQPHPFGFE